jgi:hypothetical protein
VPIAALLSMGESWHNNHHAYPGSARIGLDDDQPDPGWWFILLLHRLGLAWNIKTPATMPARAALMRVSDEDGGCPACGVVLRWWRRFQTPRRPRLTAAGPPFSPRDTVLLVRARAGR